MGSIGDNQLAALSGYSGTIQDLIRKALYIDDLGGYLGRTSFWSSPADESNLIGWYYPDNIQVSGSNITEWTDASSEGNDLTLNPGVPPQATGDINGITCATFNNSTYIATGSVAYTQPFTCLIVARDDNATNRRTLFSGHTSSADAPTPQRFGKEDGTTWTFNWGNQVSLSYSREANPYVFVVVVNAASSKFYIDGTLIGTGSFGALGLDRICLGGIFNTFTCWQGDIAEAIILSKEADATSLNRNGQYLADIYGTTWNEVS